MEPFCLHNSSNRHQAIHGEVYIVHVSKMRVDRKETLRASAIWRNISLFDKHAWLGRGSMKGRVRL